MTLTRVEVLSHCKSFGPGTKAYYDAHLHMFPCTVLEVLEEGNGYFVVGGRLRIRCDRTTGPYRKDEELEVSAFHTFPRSHRYVREFFYRINPWYKWVKPQEDQPHVCEEEGIQEGKEAAVPAS